MRQTTSADTHHSTGPLSGAGPYEYDLPVAQSGAGQPAPVRRPGWKDGFSWKSVFVIIFGNMAAQSLSEWSGLSPLHTYTILYCLIIISVYWDMPKPRPSFLRWTLKVVGIFLNLFIALVTVPRSLRGLLPDSLASALPAFAFFLVLYWVPPLTHLNRKRPPLWQWLLWAAVFATFWGWLGPLVVK
jgi:hypothetical protein